MMKKKILSIIAVSLVMAMMGVSLTGCGTEAKATDQEMEDGETIIVTDDEETVINVEEEVIETEVVEGEEAEAETAFAGAENNEIVLYSEIEEYGEYMPMKDEAFETESNTVVAYEDIPIYNGDGVEVGYIKNGSTVTLTESATEYYWARFENPIKGAEYDYLYLLKDYIVETQRVENALSADEMKQIISDSISETFAKSTIISSPTSEMAVCEFIITNDNKLYAIHQTLDEELYMGSDAYMYKTFYVECTEDEDGEPYIHCKVYFKDLYEDDTTSN